MPAADGSDKLFKVRNFAQVCELDEHQLDMMGEYGELNERLYLSYRYNKFVEPAKEMAMGNTLPTYKVYFQILARQISRDEYMKLPIEEALY